MRDTTQSVSLPKPTPLPPALSNLVNLTRINIPTFNLTGGLSPVTNLVELEHLNLVANNLSNGIPEQINRLRRLQYLYLNSNKLGGLLIPIPHKLGTLGCLNELNLSNNNLCGEIPESLGELDYIQERDLSNNNLEGEIPLSIYLKMEEEGMRLNVLNLYGNRLDPVPPELSHFEIERGSFEFSNLYTGSMGF
ncbi:hypothetical protein BDR26DRAFT_900977 [Obelidium mucronatum]|nr:hypothetical protein BDR26DRAFT_900977 [Obelidium mucronatum]